MATKLIIKNTVSVGFGVLLGQINSLMFNTVAKEVDKIDFFKDNEVDEDFIKNMILASFVSLSVTNFIAYIKDKNKKLEEKLKDNSA